jgi:hypothetical protein
MDDDDVAPVPKPDEVLPELKPYVPGEVEQLVIDGELLKALRKDFSKTATYMLQYGCTVKEVLPKLTGDGLLKLATALPLPANAPVWEGCGLALLGEMAKVRRAADIAKILVHTVQIFPASFTNDGEQHTCELLVMEAFVRVAKANTGVIDYALQIAKRFPKMMEDGLQNGRYVLRAVNINQPPKGVVSENAKLYMKMVTMKISDIVKIYETPGLAGLEKYSLPLFDAEGAMELAQAILVAQVAFKKSKKKGDKRPTEMEEMTIPESFWQALLTRMLLPKSTSDDYTSSSSSSSCSSSSIPEKNQQRMMIAAVAVKLIDRVTGPKPLCMIRLLEEGLLSDEAVSAILIASLPELMKELNYVSKPTPLKTISMQAANKRRIICRFTDSWMKLKAMVPHPINTSMALLHCCVPWSIDVLRYLLESDPEAVVANITDFADEKIGKKFDSIGACKWLLMNQKFCASYPQCVPKLWWLMVSKGANVALEYIGPVELLAMLDRDDAKMMELASSPQVLAALVRESYGSCDLEFLLSRCKSKKLVDRLANGLLLRSDHPERIKNNVVQCIIDISRDDETIGCALAAAKYLSNEQILLLASRHSEPSKLAVKNSALRTRAGFEMLFQHIVRKPKLSESIHRWSGRAGTALPLAFNLARTPAASAKCWQICNGKGFDAGGISAELFNMVGNELVAEEGAYLDTLDGFKIPALKLISINQFLLGAVLAQASLVDIQAVGIEIHPIILLHICRDALEKLPWQMLAAVLGKEWLLMLAPATLYNAKPSFTMLMAEASERYNAYSGSVQRFVAGFNSVKSQKKICDIIISPKAIFNTLRGEATWDVAELCKRMKVVPHKSPKKKGDDDDDSVVVKKDHSPEEYSVALAAAMGKLPIAERRDFYRFWFGSEFPVWGSRDVEQPKLQIIAESKYPMLQSHTCSYAIDLPSLKEVSGENLTESLLEIINRSLCNQRNARETGELFQFQ